MMIFWLLGLVTMNSQLDFETDPILNLIQDHFSSFSVLQDRAFLTLLKTTKNLWMTFMKFLRGVNLGTRNN